MADDRAADSSGELAFAVEQLIGHKLDGRYRIEALLGKGGMGAVLRARHTFMDQPVAIKVLRPTLARDPVAARRFVREARGTVQVDSEHAVKVTDFGCSPDGIFYMVLELLDGHTLGAELGREVRLAPRRAVHIARQVALALAAAHRVGLIHRDLKPDNVMLIRRGGDPDFVKVLDFGLVKVIEGAGQRALSMAALTQGDVVFGTPDYMAPEQALGQALDQRTDLYALGATLFEMVAGRPVFEADGDLAMLVAQVRQAPPRLAEVASAAGVGELDPALDRLVARMLAKDPAARPASAQEVVEELAAVASRMAGAVLGRVAHARTMELPFDSALAESVRPGSGTGTGSGSSNGSGLPPPRDLGGPRVPASPLHALGSDTGSGTSNGSGLPPPRDLGGPRVPASSVHALGSGSGSDSGSVPTLRPRRRALVLGGLALAASAIVAVVVLSGGRTRPAAVVVAADGSVATTDAAAVATAVDAGLAPAIDARPPPPAPVAPRADTAERDRHLAAAEQARRAGNSLKQLAEADLALDLDPRSVRAHYLMGDALVTSGDLATGCRSLARARRLPAAAARARAAGCPTD